MTRHDHERLYEIAAEHGGYFTTADAKQAGFDRHLIKHHVRAGRFERIKRGLYRLKQFPATPDEEVIAAWMAAGPQAIVSHETALRIHGLSDFLPHRIHVTVPRTYRWVRRRVPRNVVVHTTSRPLSPGDAVTRGPLRLTSATRSILDAAEIGSAPEQIVSSVRQAIQEGLATRSRLLSGARGRSRRVIDLITRALSDSHR